MKNLLLLLGVIAFMSIAAIPANTPTVEQTAFELPDAAADIIGTWETIDDETGKAKSHVRIFLAKTVNITVKSKNY